MCGSNRWLTIPPGHITFFSRKNSAIPWVGDKYPVIALGTGAAMLVIFPRVGRKSYMINPWLGNKKSVISLPPGRSFIPSRPHGNAHISTLFSAANLCNFRRKSLLIGWEPFSNLILHDEQMKELEPRTTWVTKSKLFDYFLFKHSLL